MADESSDRSGNNVSIASSGNTSISFRFYSYGAEGSTGSGGLAGNLSFNGTITAIPTAPSTQASNFGSTGITAGNATISWTRGNGDGVLVVARSGGAVNADPTDGTDYTASATFGSGTQVGTGNWVVYKGSGTSVDVTGLSPSTVYHFAIYEYTASGFLHNMAELTGNIATSASGSPILTAATLASALSATNGTASAPVSFTASGSNLSGNITVTAQSGYEVSTSSGSGYGASVSVASGTTVWVRFASSQAAGTYNSATAAVLSSTGAANVNLSTSASGNTVSAAPVVVFTEGLNNSTAYVSASGGDYVSGNSSTTAWPNNVDLVSEGSHAWRVSNANRTLTSMAIDTTHGNSMSLGFRLAAFAGSSGNGMEDSDTVTLATSTDNGTTWSSEILVTGTNSSRWSFGGGTGNASAAYDGNNIAASFSPASGGEKTTDGYSTVHLSGLPQAAQFRFRITAVNNSADERWHIDEIVFRGVLPTVSANTTSLAAFTGTDGTASANQTFTVNGTNLVGDITVGPLTGFEFSTDGTAYSGSLALARSGDSVANTTIHVRLAANAQLGTYNSQTISIASTGAITKTVTTAATGNTMSANPSDLTAFATAVTQNFNSLASTGTSSSMPTGWYFSEGGTGADGNYTASSTSSSGDTFSMGSGSNSERALGSIRTGTFNSTYGVALRNTTGSTITTLVVSYTGETWRVATANRPDRIDFAYSTDAIALGSGTWTDVDSLDYANPGQATGSGSLQHSAVITQTITGLSIPNNGLFFLRWADADATGSDDMAGIDDVGITALGDPAVTINGSGSNATSADFTTTFGTASANQAFTIGGSNLQGDITATAGTGFEVSSDGTAYGATATFTRNATYAASGTLYARLTATASASGTYTDSTVATLAGTNAAPRTISTDSNGSGVTPRILTIAGISVPDKAYDGTTTATIAGNASYSGLVNGESHSVSGSPTATFDTPAAGTGKAVVVSGYTAPTANYSISQPSLTGNITTASVTVTAGNQTKAFGASDPAFTYTSSPASLIAGNSFTGAPSRAAGEGAGTYAISQGTLSAGGNYTITFVGANLTITAINATVSTGTAGTPGETSVSISGSNVTADGGASVAARGIAYGTRAFPTISNSTTSDGTGTGSFNANLNGLTPGVRYFFRAYATNSAGTAYGAQGNFTTTAPTPLAPVLSRASMAANSLNVTINWADLSNETSYDLQHSTNSTFSANTTTVGGIAAGSTSQSISVATGLRFVRVRGVNSHGNGTWSDTQTLQVQSLSPGTTRYLSIPGTAAGGNGTVAQTFGPNNESGLASAALSNSTSVILQAANGSSQAGVWFFSGNWVRGGSTVNNEAIPAGRAFMLRNNSNQVDHIVISGAPFTDAESPTPVTITSNVTVLAPASTSPVPLAGALSAPLPSAQTAGLLRGLTVTASPSAANHFKAGTTMSQADQISVVATAPGQASGNFWYCSKAGVNGWCNGSRKLSSIPQISPASVIIIRKGAGSTLGQWTPPGQ